jgi:hypothetical protein
MSVALDLLSAGTFPHWRGNSRPFGMSVTLNLLCSNHSLRWQGIGRAFATRVFRDLDLDLVPFPIGEAMAKPLGRPLVRQWPNLWNEHRSESVSPSMRQRPSLWEAHW